MVGTFAATLLLTYWLPNVIAEAIKFTVPLWYILSQARVGCNI
jgi:hypothetical protein